MQVLGHILASGSGGRRASHLICFSVFSPNPFLEPPLLCVTEKLSITLRLAESTHTNTCDPDAEGVSLNTFVTISGSWDNSNCKHATGGISHWRREGWGNACKCVCGPRRAAADQEHDKPLQWERPRFHMALSLQDKVGCTADQDPYAGSFNSLPALQLSIVKVCLWRQCSRMRWGSIDPAFLHALLLTRLASTNELSLARWLTHPQCGGEQRWLAGPYNRMALEWGMLMWQSGRHS